MLPIKEYALLCEFTTQSTNGLYSYAHVFDQTAFKADVPKTLHGFLATRFINLPVESELEVYVTDGTNTVVDRGTLFKQKVQGPSMHLMVRLGGFTVPAYGDYRFWTRINGGEPVMLCGWAASEKRDKPV